MLKLSAILLAAASLSAEPARFSETLYPSWGQNFSVSEEIYRENTEFADLVIFDNPVFGRVLALDGAIQLTEADEPVYHEMMVHVPLFSHDNPALVMIIGGGDGGTLREVLKHTSVKRVVLVEIDNSVIEMSKKYFPMVSKGAYEDPRVEVVIEDAAEYVKSAKESFDAIICDSCDPVGPAAVLFTSEFYGNCKKCLNKDGIFVNMNGVPFMQPDEIPLTYKNRTPHFKHVGFYIAPVPTYVGGFMAFGWATDKDYRVSEETLHQRVGELSGSFYYYTPEIHKASFALPKFIKRLVE